LTGSISWPPDRVRKAAVLVRGDLVTIDTARQGTLLHRIDDKDPSPSDLMLVLRIALFNMDVSNEPSLAREIAWWVHFWSAELLKLWLPTTHDLTCLKCFHLPLNLTITSSATSGLEISVIFKLMTSKLRKYIHGQCELQGRWAGPS
jgi:hypothetical protein